MYFDDYEDLTGKLKDVENSYYEIREQLRETEHEIQNIIAVGREIYEDDNYRTEEVLKLEGQRDWLKHDLKVYEEVLDLLGINY